MSLRTVVQTACAEIGIETPQFVASNPDTQIRQIYALANREGRELAKMAWQSLTQQYQATTVLNVDTYDLPADYGWPIPSTEWDHANHWRLIGPTSAQQWQLIKRGIFPRGPRRRYRLLRNKFVVDPVPSESGQSMSLEYISKFWVDSESGLKPEYINDEDESVLNEELITLGVIWRWKSSKGLEFSQDYETWRRTTDSMYSRDKSAIVLPLGKTRADFFGGPMSDDGLYNVAGITLAVQGELIPGPQGPQGPAGPPGASGAATTPVTYNTVATTTGEQVINVVSAGLPAGRTTGMELRINGVTNASGYTFDGTILTIPITLAVVTGDTIQFQYFPA